MKVPMALDVARTVRPDSDRYDVTLAWRGKYWFVRFVVHEGKRKGFCVQRDGSSRYTAYTTSAHRELSAAASAAVEGAS